MFTVPNPTGGFPSKLLTGLVYVKDESTVHTPEQEHVGVIESSETVG